MFSHFFRYKTMYLQFGDDKPIHSNSGVALETAQQSVKIALQNAGLYTKDDKFTIVVKDLDAPGGTYYHSLIVNADRRLYHGDTVLEYRPPQKSNHRYVYEIYLQANKIRSPMASRQNFDFATFANLNQLQKLYQVAVTTQPYQSYGDQLEENTQEFMKPSDELSDQEKKYCRCVLHVKAGGRGRNPYAICSKSIGSNVRTCGDHYDYEVMPLPELLAYADLKKLRVPDRTSRRSVIDAIFSWKEGKY